MRRKLFATGAVLLFVGCAVGTHDPAPTPKGGNPTPVATTPSTAPASIAGGKWVGAGPPVPAPSVAATYQKMIAQFDAALEHGYTTDRTTGRVIGDSSTPDYRVREYLKAQSITPFVSSPANFNVLTGAPIHATPAAYSNWGASSPTDIIAFAVDGTAAGRGITTSAQVAAGTYASGAGNAVDSGLLILTNLYTAGLPSLQSYAPTSLLPLTDSFHLSGILFNAIGTRVYALSQQGHLFCFNVPATTAPASAMTACPSWPAGGYSAGSTVTWSSPYPTYASQNEIREIYFGDDAGKLHCVQGALGTAPGTRCTNWSAPGTLVLPTSDAAPVGPPVVNIDSTSGKNTIIVGDDRGRFFRVTDDGTNWQGGGTSEIESQDLCTLAPNTCPANPWAIRGTPAINFTTNLVYVASGGQLFEFPLSKTQNGGVWERNNNYPAKNLYTSTNAQIEGSVTLDYAGFAYIAFHNTFYKAKTPFDGTATGNIYSTALDVSVAGSDNYPRGYALPFYGSLFLGTGTNSGTTGIVEQYGCTSKGAAPTLTAISSTTPPDGGGGSPPPFGSLIETGEIVSWQNSNLYFGYDSGGTSGGLVEYPAGSPDPASAWTCPVGSNSVSNSTTCGAGATVCGVGCSGGCPDTANVASTSCTGSVCTIATCNAGYADCDGNYANGCEIDTLTDVSNCGTTSAACGNACPTLNETPTCVGGVCGGTCNAGYASCSGGACAAASCSSCCSGACTGGGTVGTTESCGGTGCVAATVHECAEVSEHSTATVTCPTGAVIQAISFVSYGTPNGSCGSFTVDTTCDDATGNTGASGTPAPGLNERKIAADLCYGQNTCSIVADNAVTQTDGKVLGDPCNGVFKRMYLQVECACPTVAPECSNGYRDGLETDVDCGGGTCAACPVGDKCGVPTDCTSGTCTSGVCVGAPCTAGTDNNCVLTTTPSGNTDTGSCASGYSGSCSFSCSNGTWSQVTDTCAPNPCSAGTDNNCVLTTTSSGNTDTGTCASGYTGACSFSCSAGTWTQVTDTCAAQCAATTDNHCVLTLTNSGTTDTGSCAGGYVGACSFSCTNGAWSQVTDTCAEECAATTDNHCVLTTTTSGSPETGTCASGYVGACSYTCGNNDGVWGAPSTNTCAEECAATTDNNCVLTTTTSGSPETGTCASGYAGACSYTCGNNNGVWGNPHTNTCAEECAATTDNNCVLATTTSGSSDTGTCASGYTGSCSYTCGNNNGVWGNPHTNTCVAQCAATTDNNCVLTTTNSGSTDTGTCASGYTGACSFSCNAGTWTQVTDTCLGNTGTACTTDADCVSGDCQCTTSSGSCTGNTGTCGSAIAVNAAANGFNVFTSCSSHAAYVEAWGGGGGAGGRGAPGATNVIGGGGAFVAGVITAASSGTLTVTVAGGGQSVTGATTNAAGGGGKGEGTGTRSAGGGGGETSVVLTAALELIAAGGGGGSSYAGGTGGAAGIATGSNGLRSAVSCTNSNGGTNGHSDTGGTSPIGTGGTSTSGGGGNALAITNGTGGGGGGGGIFGGGGGAGDTLTGVSVGGAGGASWFGASVTSQSSAAATTSTAGNLATPSPDYALYCVANAGNAGTTQGVGGVAGCVVVRCQ